MTKSQPNKELKIALAEIKRLQTEHDKVCNSRREWMEACIAARHEIQHLKAQISTPAPSVTALIPTSHA